MADRKPPGVSWETWIDRQIVDGMESGAFDHLPGIGRPIADLGKPRDEYTWVRDKLRREKVAPPPPPAIQIRIEVDAAMAALAGLGTEAEVRSLVEHLNARIREVNRTVAFGPPTTVGPLPVEEVLDRWERLRATEDEPA